MSLSFPRTNGCRLRVFEGFDWSLERQSSYDKVGRRILEKVFLVIKNSSYYCRPDCCLEFGKFPQVFDALE